MNAFLENLKRDAAANPMVAIGVATALLAAAGKFVDAAGSARSKRAYAKVMENAVKNVTKK